MCDSYLIKGTALMVMMPKDGALLNSFTFDRIVSFMDKIHIKCTLGL